MSCDIKQSRSDEMRLERNECKYKSTTLSLKTDDPKLFQGTSFGVFFQMLHKTGDYKTMLSFTSTETKRQFSDSLILDFFYKMNFSYNLKIKAFKENTLFYETSINATTRTIQMKVLVENDTCRVVFSRLDANCPFCVN